VRVLTNTSTGYTGAGIASYLDSRGHDVVLLRAARSIGSRGRVREELFTTFADLDAALQRLLAEQPFDAVIHAAAVSDFTVDTAGSAGGALSRGRKITSSDALTLRLRPLPKLVAQLRTRSANPDIAVVAFKLTAGAPPDEQQRAVASLLGAAADVVVHNDLTAKRDSPEDFPSTVHVAGGGEPHRCATRRELSERLEEVLLEATTPPNHAALSRHR
jgi:phosphopantothenoylcysteine decarboxylase / phosphopantothenate---cysteine ligase